MDVTKLKILLYTIILTLSQLTLFGQYYKAYYDGPYIFQNSDTVSVKWIEAGDYFDTTFIYSDGEFPDLPVFQKMSIPIQEIYKSDITPTHQTDFGKVSRIAAVSDIHGQFDLMKRLFEANELIDADGDWSFGDGHLVITGDVFDRGPSVVDILWFLIKLEHQAESAGGKLHLTLGNHEVMVLKSDLRYIHKKYRYTSAKLVMPYNQFFESNTFLGKWIRSKPVYISLNDIGFVHAGISKSFFELEIPINELNKYHYENVINKNEDELIEDPASNFLYFDRGPLWYRGYAFEEEMNEKEAKLILKKLKKKHIVVGHTSMSQVMSIFNNKIIFIDSSIKLGKTGELLFYENKKFYAAGLNGKKRRL